MAGRGQIIFLLYFSYMFFFSSIGQLGAGGDQTGFSSKCILYSCLSVCHLSHRIHFFLCLILCYLMFAVFFSLFFFEKQASSTSTTTTTTTMMVMMMMMVIIISITFIIIIHVPLHNIFQESEVRWWRQKGKMGQGRKWAL